MSIINHVPIQNKGSICSIAEVQIHVQSADGSVHEVKMDGLSSSADDYSLRNLDKQGIVVRESDPTGFIPLSLDDQDEIYNQVQSTLKYTENEN